MIHTNSQASDYQTTFSAHGMKAMADAPVEKGGGSAGFGPHELLEAALATCINMAVRMSASGRGIPLESVATSVQLDRSNPDVTTFRYTLELPDSLTIGERQHLEAAASACPVRQTLAKKLKFVALSG